MIPGPVPPSEPGRSDRKAVDVSTHRRAWQQRAGVVVALVAGALLAVPATPALAAPDVNDVSASPSSVEAGRSTKVRFSLDFADGAPPANVQVSSNNGKLRCVDGCSYSRVTEGRSFEATFQLAEDAANGTAVVTVRATDASGPGETKEASTSVTLVGRAAPTTQPQVQTVKRISGRVTNSGDGKAVPNATVALIDSQRHTYTTTTDEDGDWRFDGSTQNPISPGRIELGATFNDVRKTMSITANAGQSVTGQRISLALAVEPSASPTPGTTEEATPTEDPTEEPTAETTEAAPGTPDNAANEEDSGGFGSWLLIVLGGLFVAIGVGTIVLLWMKRKESVDEDDPEADTGAPAGGTVPAARGAYRGGADDQTRVVNRVGADPTMVGGAALADAPTMMHNRPLVDDVPPDPYGAPPIPPQQGPGYGGQSGQTGWGGGYGDSAGTQVGGYGAGGYGNAPSSGGPYGNAPASGGGGYGNAPASGGGGYGNAPASGGGGYGNAPASGGGGYGGQQDYGTPGGGYATPNQGGSGYGERFDEPTGRYGGDSAPGYAPPADPYPTSTYQPADGGHGYGPDQTQGGYGRGQEPTGGYGYGGTPAGGGYDQQGGYDQGGRGGYGGDRGGQQQGGYGYDQPGGGYGSGGYGSGGYDQQGGYDPRGGYDQQGGYGGQGGQQGGYGYDQQGGYDQGGRGRDGQPPQDRSGRRADWHED
ncbi:carboxypeptidase-like regulatory domain-containing protein [Micromonospora sp. WMMD882]|uniref:carboxypeptidase-like regulatory domain-containing protein n=1 Tax=Micromonospora sp. WMMD882 TaxID=3015151 RepID=UPI00248B5F44|nr:carboxypeptidase-like regulatory domain-containing protein [Micromonospora sp. WMMD882]WBB78142.1 carboxypeptidase-like regulatory domain-containing protein [Micromonospora sp. WMMD882]